jgi:hypothetical protein
MKLRLPAAAAALALAIWPGPSWAQTTGPRLVIVAPKPGAVTGPNVIVVIDAQGVPAGTGVAFKLSIDSDSFARTFLVHAGTPARIPLGQRADGEHQITLAPTAPQVAHATVKFRIGQAASGGFSPIALILGVALVGLFLFYRRRVMEPFTRRYENGPSGKSPGRGSGGRPTR